MIRWQSKEGSLFNPSIPFPPKAQGRRGFAPGPSDPSATLSLPHLYLENDLPDLAFERYRAAIAAPEPVAAGRTVESVEMVLNSSDWTRGKEVAPWIDLSETYKATLDPTTGVP